MSAFDGVVAKMGTTGDEKKSRLGDLFWYSVAEDIDVERDELINMFADLGISEEFLPNPIRPAHAFKRATSALQENRIEITEDRSRFANLIIEDVVLRGDVVRHLVQVIVDQENVRLGYDEVASYKFLSDTAEIDFKVIQHSVVSQVLEEKILNTKNILAQLYPKFCNVYNGRAIREVVKNILDSTNPTAVRPSGALYFVPYFHNDILFKLERLLNLLSEKTDKTVDCHTVELYDAEKHRKMLAEKLTDQTDEKVDELITKIAISLKSENGIKQTVAETYYNEYRKLLTHTEEYERLLEKQLVVARSKLEILQEQIRKVLDSPDKVMLEKGVRTT